MLNHNQISKLPQKKIGELKFLTHLDLSHNCISEIPNSFCDIVALKVLNLEGNCLKIFPIFFDRLANLKTLRLNGEKNAGKIRQIFINVSGAVETQNLLKLITQNYGAERAIFCLLCIWKFRKEECLFAHVSRDVVRFVLAPIIKKTWPVINAKKKY